MHVLVSPTRWNAAPLVSPRRLIIILSLQSLSCSSSDDEPSFSDSSIRDILGLVGDLRTWLTNDGGFAG